MFKATPPTEINKKAASFIGESNFEVVDGKSFGHDSHLDPRMILSERPNASISTPASAAKSQATSLNSSETILTRLGASVIKQVDLCSLVNSIFDEEYDPINIKRRTEARQARHSFSFKKENLGVKTDCT